MIVRRMYFAASVALALLANSLHAGMITTETCSGVTLDYHIPPLTHLNVCVPGHIPAFTINGTRTPPSEFPGAFGRLVAGPTGNGVTFFSESKGPTAFPTDGWLSVSSRYEWRVTLTQPETLDFIGTILGNGTGRQGGVSVKDVGNNSTLFSQSTDGSFSFANQLLQPGTYDFIIGTNADHTTSGRALVFGSMNLTPIPEPSTMLMWIGMVLPGLRWFRGGEDS